VRGLTEIEHHRIIDEQSGGWDQSSVPLGTLVPLPSNSNRTWRCRTWFDLCCGHLRGELHQTLWIPYCDNFCGAHRDAHNRDQCAVVLRPSGTTRARGGKNGDGVNSEAFIVSPGLHWRPDYVERYQRVAIFNTPFIAMALNLRLPFSSICAGFD
jgi:hypothetical protein